MKRLWHRLRVLVFPSAFLPSPAYPWAGLVWRTRPDFTCVNPYLAVRRFYPSEAAAQAALGIAHGRVEIYPTVYARRNHA